MADKLDDPYHLVALMSYVFFRMQDSSPRRLDSSFHKLKYGIVDNHETNVRTIPITDALAHICVSAEKGQTFAVALQLDSVKEEARLTIAENKEVMSALVLHLNKIWGKLQALSNEYVEQRIAKSEVHQLVSKPGGVTTAPGGNHQKCPQTWMSRITKWRERRGLFLVTLDELRLGADLEGFEQDLSYNSPGNPITDEEWEEAYFEGMMVNHYANLVLADRQECGCEILALKLQSNRRGDPFPLRRALEKLTYLPRHIDTLLVFAQSPRLRPALQYRMFVSPIPKQTRTIKLPASQEEWKFFLKTACGEHDDDGLEASAVKLLKLFGSEEWACPVHCECGLIQYLQTKQGISSNWDNVPAFGYIGVSKLSCSSCRIWIEAFNEQSGPQFYTTGRGSRGKWYWP
ncbi:hypothetical protein HOY82DRAFT_605409 [Tuber indicum]|nr:hypothetical protein HOY82DRAFT_605409 [Tuber indicum]